MSATVQRRVEALEAAGTGASDFILIVVTIVRPGHLDAEVATAEMMGQRFERLPSETEDDFIARLKQYAEEHQQPGLHAVQAICRPINLDL